MNAIKRNASGSGLGYQGDLFNMNPVINTAKKQGARRTKPLEELVLLYGDERATARKYAITKRTLYHVVFSTQRTPLVVAIAKRFNGDDFWTSIPERRQKEAEEIGRLIDEALMK